MSRWRTRAWQLGAVALLLPLGHLTLHRDDGAVAAQILGLPFPTVMAHRGASYLAPEETAWAYRVAKLVGADFLEADIQRSKDGVLIALHDDTLLRTTNVAAVFPDRAQQTVGEFTWEELSRLDAGSWFNAKFPDRARPEFASARILRLDQLIDIALASDKPSGLYLETKAPERFPGIEAALIRQLEQRGYLSPSFHGKLVFQSFSAASLLLFKQLAPAVPRVYLLDEEMVRRDGFATLVGQARELAQGIGPVGYYAYPWHTRRAHAAGLVVHPYTLNQGWQLRLGRWFGADGAFTDRCELALTVYGRRSPVDVAALWREAAASSLGQ